MKTKLNKFSYWVFATMFAFAIIFASCSKNDELTTNNDENYVEATDFSEYVGGALQSPAELVAKLPLAEVPNTKAIAASRILPTPAVGNQGRDGACVGWGVGYAARSVMKGGNITFSPAYIYNQIKLGNCSQGSYPVDAINLVYNQGVCTWNYMPYRDGDCYTQPSSSAKQNAANYKISGAARVNRDYQSIRAQIAAGRPVIVAGPVDSYFQNLGYNKILTQVSGSGGGHCYAVVGYYDDYNCFKIMNSWGTGWATNGFGYVSYNVVGRLFTEAYVMYE